MVKRKPAKPQEPPAKAPAQEPDAGSASLLPMEVQIGDRFTDHGLEWQRFCAVARACARESSTARAPSDPLRDDVGGARARHDPAQSVVTGVTMPPSRLARADRVIK